MKLKNSYILIGIAILLLISIGSVCASENVTDDSGDTLADDGTDVVLSDTDGSVPDDTKEKINTTVETDKDKYEFKQDSNKTITVNVKDNESQQISVNKNDLSISNGNKSINFEYNSSMSLVTITEQLPFGYYNLTVNYLGNGTYINSYKNITVKIYGNNTIETETSVVCDGKNVEIPVKIYDQAEYIELIKGNFNLTLVYTNETGNVCNLNITDFRVENNTIKFESPVALINASVIVDYANATEPKTVSVKISTEVKAEKDEYKFKSEEIKNISIKILDGQGNLLNISKNDLKVFVNDIEETNFEYNNASLTLALTNNGTYNLTVTYLGNSSYNASSSNVIKIKVYVETEVIANPDTTKYRFNETNNIVVTVKDINGNILSINKTDLKVFDNGKEITNFKLNNTNITVELDVGVHDLTILYKGNDTYATSNTTITVKVWGNQTFNPDKTANLDSNGYANITLNLSDGADPVNVNVDNLNLTLFYTQGNNTYNKTISVINLLDDKQTVRFNVDEKFDSAYIDIKYVAENNLTAKTTIKLGTDIIVPVSMNEAAGKVIDFITKVYLANGTEINVTVNNTKVYKDGKEIKFTYNGSTITLNETFTFGDYNITVKYLGNETYSEVAKSFMLKVYGINATSPINVNSSKIGEVKIDIINGNETLDVPINELNLTVTYKDGNITRNITVTPVKYENGTLTFTLENGNFTTATLTIKYNETETNVTLNRIYNAKLEAVLLENEYMTGNFTFKLIDVDTNEPIANKTVSFETDNYFTDVVGSITSSNPARGSAKSDANGILNFVNSKIYALNYGMEGSTISLKFHYMDVGNYNVTLKPGDNLKFDAFKTNITINKANLIISPAKFSEYYGTDKKYSITVTSATTGEILPNILLKLVFPQISNTSYYLSTNSEGIAEIGGLSSLVGGDYKVVISNNDTKNVNNVSKEDTLTIKKIPVKIIGKDVTVQFNTGTTYTIKVTKDGKALEGMYVLVRLYTTSSKYSDYLFQTNSKGQIAFSASLAVGKHKIIINSADNRYSASQVTKTITVKKASAKITAKKVTTYYKGGKYFTVKLTNTKKKKPIYDGKVNIKIFVSKNRYYNYNGNTGMNGQLKLLLDSLKPGTYKVVVSGADKKNFNAKEVTSKIVIKKAPAKIKAKKLTAKKGANKYFKVTVKNKKTKKAIGKVKVKVKVYTGKKAKTYALKTNAKGIAKLNVNALKVGKHKVVISSANKYVVAKKAKSTIKIKK